MSKHEMKDYTLRVKGVFGRNRKAKFESYRLLRVDRDEVVETERVMEMTRDTLSAIKAKPGLAWQLVCCPITVEKVDGGTVTKFMMMSDTTIATGAV